MPIRNFTSTKSPNESIGLMMDLLADMNARDIGVRYDDARRPISLTFTVPVREVPVPFRLEVDPGATLAAMQADDRVPPRYCTEEQAMRTAWKNKHDWLDVMLAQIRESDIDLAQMFLGFAVVDDEGRTAYELIRQNPDFLARSDAPKRLPPHRHDRTEPPPGG